MEILNGIKNIIFDLGGVVINIDYRITLNELRSLGLKDAEKVYTQFNQQPWFDAYDTGRISSDAFINEFRKFLNQGTSREQIIHAWNAMLLDFPGERAELLKKLRNRYRTFLLSNTNELHVEYYLPKIQEWFGKEGMKIFLEKEYYSHLMGMRKPETETFHFILRENQLNPSETLFIDDSLQHVEGAKKAGIKTYHLKAPETILHVFAEFL